MSDADSPGLPTRREFTSTILKAGINPYVDVPEEIGRTFGTHGNIPVKGFINEYSIRATLVPIGGGRHRLYINGEMRRGAGVEVGDTIRVSLEPDNEPRELPVPLLLRKFLDSDSKAGAAWDKLPPSYRREYLAYLNSLKTPEALERNVRKVIAELIEKP